MRLRRMIVAESTTARLSRCAEPVGTWPTRAAPVTATVVTWSPASSVLLPAPDCCALAALSLRVVRLLRLGGVAGQSEEHVIEGRPPQAEALRVDPGRVELAHGLHQ